MKFEIEDIVVQADSILLIILKAGLFSTDMTISKQDLFKFTQKQGLISQDYYTSQSFIEDLYQYLTEKNLVKDIIQFEN